MEDMQSTPDMAEAPVDMGSTDAPADMPDEEMDAPDAGMVCEPNMARCASESVREVCTEDGAGMRAEPCDAGEVCVGDGACGWAARNVGRFAGWYFAGSTGSAGHDADVAPERS